MTSVQHAVRWMWDSDTLWLWIAAVLTIAGALRGASVQAAAAGFAFGATWERRR